MVGSLGQPREDPDIAALKLELVPLAVLDVDAKLCAYDHEGRELTADQHLVRVGGLPMHMSYREIRSYARRAGAEVDAAAASFFAGVERQQPDRQRSQDRRGGVSRDRRMTRGSAPMPSRRCQKA